MGATERQGEAITKHDRSMAVTAGAGTGKTYVLVRKYIDLLTNKDVSVSQILALTFTDKAAAEMKERIRSEILKQEGPQWEKAAEDFMIAPVQTFHSFCAQVLREFPIEAGLEPGFSVLDEQQASRIHGQAFEDLIHTRQDGPVHEALIHVLSITEQYNLRKILLALYGKRERYEQFFSSLGDDEAHLIAVWKQEVEAFRDEEIGSLLKDPSFSSSLRTLRNLAPAYAGVDDKAAHSLQEISPLLLSLENPADTGEFCRAALDLTTRKLSRGGMQKNWKGNDLEDFHSARKILTGILERKQALFRMNVEPSDPLIAGSVQFLKSLSRVFLRYNTLVADGKASLGGLDFSDLILHARRFFMENSGLVALHFKPRFRYILVDEFQDTDMIQFGIIMAIIGELSPSMDRLFIVGDPKQSIYLFRDADVTRFKEAQEIITNACSGRTVTLDTSFRSTKEVVGFANILFSRLFASAEKPWEFGYEPVGISSNRAGHAGSVELLLPPSGDDAATKKRNEAEMVARRIHSMLSAQPLPVYEKQPDHTFLERPARYGDIAILLEQRTNLSYYLAALGEYGIPFYVHGGTGFYHRQEIFDLYSILSFLLHRHDSVSLTALLRSPYFGFADTDLFCIAQERGVTLWDKFCAYAKHDGKAARIRDLLESWQRYAGHLGLAGLLRKILAESGVYSVYAALPFGEQILANIEKLVAMARGREEDRLYSLADFVADLRMAMDEDEREGEAPLDALAENAVNIMTVHAAKGLEFPVVFVPDMGMAFPGRPASILIGDNPLMVGVKVPDPENGYALTESAVLLALREQQRQKERAERKRLLYVALTRARDHLVMSGTSPEEPGLSYDLARSRIEWIFTALGVTGDAIDAGGMELPDGLRLTIVSDPASIPAETGRIRPELIVVPEECSNKAGTWTAPEYSTGPARVKPISVSQLEEGMTGKGPVSPPASPASKTVISKYLPGVEGAKKGTIIHEVLRGRDAATVLREYGEYSEEHVRQLGEIVTNFFSSEMMKRVKRSFCEVPFVVTVEGRPVSGKIDRLCEMEDGGWVVIDNKSEPVSPTEYDAKAKEYEFSMGIYMKAALVLINKPFAGYLFFLETNFYHRIRVSDR